MLGRREAGFSLAEVVIAIATVMVLAGVVAPRLDSFYRETALEYETEVLLTTLRRAQSISRTTTEVSREYGVRSNRAQWGLVTLNGSYYTLRAEKMATSAEKHQLLPLVRVSKHKSNGETQIMFGENGGLRETSPLTIDIYCTGDTSGRQIIIDQAGRIRIERGALWRE